MTDPAAARQPPRRPAKAAAAFRIISEVAFDLDVPSHVLRFWETKFSQVRPLKRGGGRRYYRPEDVDLLRRIRALLYEDGYTIKGVQKLLRQDDPAMPPAFINPPASTNRGSAMRTKRLMPEIMVWGRVSAQAPEK